MTHWFFTISRIILAPLAFYLTYKAQLQHVGFIIIYGIISDYLDGYFARKHNKTSNIGAISDALADKILINSIALPFCLFIKPDELSLLIILSIWFARDLILTIVWLLARQSFSSLYLGKVYTALQFFFLFVAIICVIFDFRIRNFSQAMLAVFIVLGITSTSAYFKAMLAKKKQ